MSRKFWSIDCGVERVESWIGAVRQWRRQQASLVLWRTPLEFLLPPGAAGRLAAALAVFLLAAGASAQFETLNLALDSLNYASNIAESGNGHLQLCELRPGIAQRFTTGSSVVGYELTMFEAEVDRTGNVGDFVVSVGIYEPNKENRPDLEHGYVDSLVRTSNIKHDRKITWISAFNPVLAPNSDYFIVAMCDKRVTTAPDARCSTPGEYIEFSRTASDSESDDNTDGWSVANESLSLDVHDKWYKNPYPFRIRVSATRIRNKPYVWRDGISIVSTPTGIVNRR